MSPENTPEFNRSSREITADLNDRHAQPPLDGQDYQPAPFLVEDTRQGYDQDGNWHTFMEYQSGEHDPNSATLDPKEPIDYEYRLAMEIQEHVNRTRETSDYFMGTADRVDVAEAYILHLIDQNAAASEIVFGGLIRWRQIFTEQSDG